MARAFIELEANPTSAELSHAEWLGLLLDREAILWGSQLLVRTTGVVVRGTESLLTLRWRETDSNHWSRARRDRPFETTLIDLRLLLLRTSPARLLERFGTGGMPADQIRRMLGRAARLAVAFSSSPRDRAKPVRGLVEKV